MIGPLINPEIEGFFQREYIQYLGPKNPYEIAEVLQNSHLFIHSQLNDNCPNSVLEAISCGLPVVGFNSGAMSELCFFSKELLAYVSDDIFQKYEDLRRIVLVIGIDELSMADRTLYERARKLQNFLTQPFFVAEAYTGRKGEYVTAEQAIEGCERIIAGRVDNVPEQDFYLIGALPYG